MDVTRRLSSTRRLAPRLTVAACAAALLAAGIWGSFALERGYAPAFRVDRASIITDVVHRGMLIRSVAASGTFAARRLAIVSAPENGVVEAVFVQPGAHVRAGTPIARLTNPDLVAEIADARAQIAAAQADLASIRQQTVTARLGRELDARATEADVAETDDEARVERALHDEGLVGDLPFRESIVKSDAARDRERLQRAEIVSTAADGTAKIAAAQAHVTDLRVLLAQKRAQLDALLVRAAESGTVQSVAAQLGLHVTIGSEVARVADERDVEARLAVAESDARAVALGLPVALTTAGGVIHGTVSHIDPAAVNGFVQVAVALGPRTAGIRTDESVEAQIELERLRDTIWITRPAGAADDTTVALYRLAGSDRAERVSVVLGRGSNDRVSVRSGLLPGQTVIVSDMSAAGDRSAVSLK
jgi:multidrug efflux pump subunit AcrA (membrane-fusion protein)